jgi:hypothetical protein
VNVRERAFLRLGMNEALALEAHEVTHFPSFFAGLANAIALYH